MAVLINQRWKYIIDQQVNYTRLIIHQLNMKIPLTFIYDLQQNHARATSFTVIYSTKIPLYKMNNELERGITKFNTKQNVII